MRGIEELLSRTFGLNVDATGRMAIDRAVQGRMIACGVPRLEDYEARALHDKLELQQLLEQVVVHETWFFRNSESLDALMDLLRTEWLPKHRGKTLRILSVPCSTGEEPYSIAMTLAEAGIERSQVRLDGIDISHRALTKAERGIYGANSFRQEDIRTHHKYCTVAPKSVEIMPELRKWVRFVQGNLASPDFRPPEPMYDVVFCRNVLIYFERDVQERVLDNLHRLISPDGYLFVGPAEAIPATEHGFNPVGYRMSFAFRKAPPAAARVRMSGESRSAALSGAFPSLPPQRPSVPVTAAPRRDTAPLRASQPLVQTELPPIDLTVARTLADQGKLLEAAELCEAYVLRDGASAASWYLLGLVRDAIGESDRATECYRKTLFLDPRHADASMHLEMHRRGRRTNGDRQPARRNSAS